MQELGLVAGLARQGCSTRQHFCGLGLGTGQAGPDHSTRWHAGNQDRVWTALGWTGLQHLPARSETVDRSCQVGLKYPPTHEGSSVIHSPGMGTLGAPTTVECESWGCGWTRLGKAETAVSMCVD